MKKLILLTLASVLSFASFAITVPPIEGPDGVCLGTSTALSDSISGGTWTSSNTSVAVIGLTTGVATGVGAGTTMITYYAGGSYATELFTVAAAPASITGVPSSLCVGSTATLSDATSGGTWVSAITYYATIGATTGIATGVNAGVANIYYSTAGLTGCFTSVTVSIVSTATAPITGLSTVCIGSTTPLSDAVSGGTWTSAGTLIAAVSSSGVVTGISAGTEVISYEISGACGVVYETKTITVIPSVSAGTITGPSAVCAGSTITLSDAAAGGTWTSSNFAVASISSSGVVTGVSGGAVTITYTVTSSCGTAYATAAVSVSASATPDSVTGPSSVCVGSTIALSDATTGGVWSSSNTSVATVSGGVVTGVAAGTAYITYTTTNVCGTGYKTHLVTVNSTTSAGTISGSSTVMVSLTTTLADGVSGGTWTSGNPSVATVNATTGVVTGVATGTATISYAVTGCSGLAYATFVITVIPANIISGNVNFTGTSYSGPVKVWLITYDPATYILQAVDSVTVYATGTTAYYQFLGEPTDSFRMKAVSDSGIVGSYGYIPTYHTSSFYWYSANVLAHVTGTVDAGQDINMLTGIVTSGPGFIGGNVYSGANKGTATSIPITGLQMYCVNATTGAIAQQTTTDGSGSYGFSNLPLGAYYVHPENGGYLTTDYPTITLTGTNESVSTASFIEHTVSHTITPIGTTGVTNLNATTTVIAYPNPTSGKLNIQWQEPTAEKASVTISDITGREIFKSSFDMNQGTGMSQVDLSELSNGLYMISVKSAAINYNNKIQVQH